MRRKIYFFTTVLFLGSCMFVLDNNGLSEPNGTPVHDTVDDFSSRLQRVQDVCQKYSDPYRAEHDGVFSVSARLSDFNYFWFQNGFTMVCSIQKVGSNSWNKFLRLIAEHYTEDKHSSQESAREASEMSAEDLPVPVSLDCWPKCAQNHTKIIVVRHPLERLLSAYRYLHEEMNGKPDLQISLLIIQLVLIISGSNSIRQMTWPEFTDSILSWTRTSADFNDTISGYGYHWQPYWHSCSVCVPALTPSFILKMETLKRDVRNYLAAIGLERFAEQFPHKVKNQEGPTGSVAKTFYSQLTKEKIVQLYELYRLDHELFGYDALEYIEYGQDE